MGLDDIIFVPTSDSELLDRFQKNISVDAATKKRGISISSFINFVEQGYFEEGSIHEILEKCEILLCSTPPPPRNAELEERISKLRAEQANKEYKSMTQNLLPQEKTIESFREDIKSVTSQIIAVINFVLTVGGSFCFVYKAVEYALPQENIPAQALMAVLASTVVALADLYFLMKTI
ncbi:transmembrane protein [Nephila pilipes]|uniref:Transmembrane protein n=1 Tax=Nephila pilipes TaxID=299642 RepID=A0A8X6UF23_NEPPI|nr:transmembrane protein [Nephila pilipes]